MTWRVEFEDAFAVEFAALDVEVRLAILAYAELLTLKGPELGRDWVDTLHSKRVSNLKELRPTVNKVEWRVGFAFDVERAAILLAAVAKNGDKQAMKRLVKLSEDRFLAHQAALGARNATSKPKRVERKGKKR